MRELQAIGEQDVVRAFARNGVVLRKFTSTGKAAQYTFALPGLIPALVVTVYPDAKTARHASPALTINGRRVQSLLTSNVRVWVAHGVPSAVRRRIAKSVAILKQSS